MTEPTFQYYDAANDKIVTLSQEEADRRRASVESFIKIVPDALRRSGMKVTVLVNGEPVVEENVRP